MHEYSIVQSLVDAVETSSRSQHAIVRNIEVRIGELSGVDPELLLTAFQVFREGTCCTRSTMTIERVPARWCCPRCVQEIPKGSVLRCAFCHQPAELASGDEIILQRIELEVV